MYYHSFLVLYLKQGITAGPKWYRRRPQYTHTHTWLRESNVSLPLSLSSPAPPFFDWMVHHLTSYTGIAARPIAKRNTNWREVNLSPEPAPLFLELTVLCSSFLKLVQGE